MRGELYEVANVEHIITRAGLTEDEALNVEEIDVFKRTLYPIHEYGLNMIPGGKAGLRFISQMRRKDLKDIDVDDKEHELEAASKESLAKIDLELPANYRNPKLAERWRNDLNFRIKQITGRDSRMSYRQIMYARIWHASGWSDEEIFHHLWGLDNRHLTMERLNNLLADKTYFSIPYIFVDHDEDP